MKPLVSIIVPIYNVSKYLRECLETIVHQTLQEIEIILVNDCSPDPLDDEICKEYQAKDNRIVYIKHEKNLGLGGARNTAIEIAKGDYLGSVDSDDKVELNMFEVMYNNAIETNADVVVAGYQHFDDDGILDAKYVLDNKILTIKPEEIFTITNPAFWNKLWKKSLYIDNNIRFPNHLYWEDLPTTPQAYYFVNQISFIDNVLYWYRQRRSSISFAFNEKSINDYFLVFNILKDFFDKKNIFELYKTAYYQTIQNHLIYFFHQLSVHTDKEVQFSLGVKAMEKFYGWENSIDFLKCSNITLDQITDIFMKTYTNQLLASNSYISTPIPLSYRTMRNLWKLFKKIAPKSLTKKIVKSYFK